MKQAFLFSSWLASLVATLGSLFFSEVMRYPPCVLCWYQRICMYPLVIVLGLGLITQDRAAFKYGLSLSAIGWLIALYHNLLYYKILPDSAGPCSQGISCTTRFIEWGGFITIPLLSLMAFSLIIILLFLSRKSHE